MVLEVAIIDIRTPVQQNDSWVEIFSKELNRKTSVFQLIGGCQRRNLGTDALRLSLFGGRAAVLSFIDLERVPST